MPSPAVCASAQDLIAALHFVDPARLAQARVEATARPLAYALGSGEADEVALFAGLKPLLRQVLPAAELPAARARFGRLGLALGETSHRVSGPSTGGTVLFVGRDERRVREAIACEASADHDLELGRLLGYPRCCVEAYLELPPPRHNVDAFHRAFAASRQFAPRLNCLDLSIFHFISWLPCSFDCATSKAWADAVAHHLTARHGQFLGGARGASPPPCPPGCRHERFVAEVDLALGAHRLLAFEDVQVSITGPLEDGVLEVGRAWPSARDRHPQAPLNEQAREASARLAALVARARGVFVRDGALFADGVPIFQARDARLFPFGARPQEASRAG
ncbi:MAG: DUF483 domain-containing protein [Archangium sp.]|nr:DUF483 domain-containing protein [Archangium sp.]